MATVNAHYQGMYPPLVPTKAEGLGAVLAALFTPLAPKPRREGALQML
jgi:hypothetical protein